MFSPLSQVTPIEPGGQARTAAEHAALLADLRQQLEGLKATFTQSVERASARAMESIDAGADAVRGEIRSAPLVSLALAATAGVLIAVAMTQPRSRKSEWLSADWQRTADRAYAAVPDIDMAALRRRLQTDAGHARDRAVGLLPTVEQLAEAVSRMEATTFTPMLEKGAAWARGLWEVVAAARPQPK